MDDLISKNQSLVEWKEDFKGFVECLDIPRDDYNGIMAYIDEVPSVQPERKKWKWIAYGDIPTTCPCCHEDWDKYVYGDIWYNDDLPNYCPNCGEDMRGKS